MRHSIPNVLIILLISSGCPGSNYSSVHMSTQRESELVVEDTHNSSIRKSYDHPKDKRLLPGTETMIFFVNTGGQGEVGIHNIEKGRWIDYPRQEVTEKPSGGIRLDPDTTSFIIINNTNTLQVGDRDLPLKASATKIVRPGDPSNSQDIQIKILFDKLRPGVGRLSKGECSAFHVGDGIVLSAGHCFPQNIVQSNTDCQDLSIYWDSDSINMLHPSKCERILALHYVKSPIEQDYAVLKVSSPPLVSLSLSRQTRQEGTLIWVFGFPAVGKHPNQIQFSEKFCNTKFIGNLSDLSLPTDKIFCYDCPTLPGMSGSPVLDSQGNVVGIHNRGLAKDAITGKYYYTESVVSEGWNFATLIDVICSEVRATGLSLPMQCLSPAGKQ